MPSVHVIVPEETSSKIKKKLDGLIRREVLKTAQELGESDKISDSQKDFSIIIAGSSKVHYVNFVMMLFPRDTYKIIKYQEALENAATLLGLNTYTAIVYCANPEDWRGPMWNFRS